MSLLSTKTKQIQGKRMKVLKYPLIYHEKFRYPLLFCEDNTWLLHPTAASMVHVAIFQACSSPSKLS